MRLKKLWIIFLSLVLISCTSFKKEECGWKCPGAMDEVFSLELEECEWVCE
jgi:hypothetical protein